MCLDHRFGNQHNLPILKLCVLCITGEHIGNLGLLAWTGDGKEKKIVNQSVSQICIRELGERRAHSNRAIFFRVTTHTEKLSLSLLFIYKHILVAVVEKINYTSIEVFQSGKNSYMPRLSFIIYENRPHYIPLLALSRLDIYILELALTSPHKRKRC